MLANAFHDLVKEFKIVNHVGVDDFSDKLSFLYALIVHFVCIFIVTSKQFVFNPISCYCPTTASGPGFDKYLSNYCWVHGTVALGKNDSMPEGDEWKQAEKSSIIVYYQWVPFVLACQAIMVYLPRLLWQFLSHALSTIDAELLLSLTDKAVHSTGSARTSRINRAAFMLADMLRNQRDSGAHLLSRMWHKFVPWGTYGSQAACSGCGLSYAYLLVKVLYLGNAVLQLFILQWFLGFPSIFFGVYVMHDLANGVDWRFTENFPRVSYCNADGIRVLGSTSGMRFIAQCALPINMLNEKIFLFLWWFYVMVIIATTFSLILWVIRLLYTPSQNAMVRKYMRFMSNIPKRDFVVWRLFTKRYLRNDGVFFLRMIKTNAGDLVVKDVVQVLWTIYRAEFMNTDLEIHNAAD